MVHNGVAKTLLDSIKDRELDELSKEVDEIKRRLENK